MAENIGEATHFIQCDVTDDYMAHKGKLDIMFSNVGVAGPEHPRGIADLDLNQFDQVMQINVRGTLAWIKHVARVMNMVPAKSGSILCTLSISGLMVGLGPHPYSISKCTTPRIVKSVANKLCKHGVRINCIVPGPILTPMELEQLRQFYRRASPEQIREIVSVLRELEGVKCEEINVAKAGLFLASDDA